MSEQVKEKIEELTEVSFIDLLIEARILVSSIFLYILRPNADQVLWPFAAQTLIPRNHKLIALQPEDADGEGFELKIMSYNVLADKHIGYFVYGAGPKNKQSIYTLEFGHRFEKIIHEIEQSDCDVIAL